MPSAGRRSWICSTAELTLRSPRESPGLMTHGVVQIRVGNFKCPFGSSRFDKRGIGLLVIPLVGVGHPLRPIEVQQLSFDGATAGRIT